MSTFEQWFDETASGLGLGRNDQQGEPMAHSQGEDGDDNNGQRVAGYDTPETYKPNSTGHSKVDAANPNAYLAIEGKEFLAKDGARIINNGEKDHYKRDLVEGVTSKGTRVANEMVAAGLALPMDDESYGAWAAAKTARAMGLQGSSFKELEDLGQQAMSSPVHLGTKKPWYEGHDFGMQGQGFGDSIGRGVDQMQQDIGSLMRWFGRSVGSSAVEDYGKKQATHNEFQLRNNTPEIARFDDIESISDGLAYAVETAGALAPQLLIDLAVGVATGGASLAASAARGALTKLSAGQVFKRGAIAGAAGSSMATGIGGIESTLEAVGIESTLSPLISGMVIGALDILPVFDAIEKLATTAGIGDQAKRSVMQRIGNTLMATAGGAGKEGVTSIAQAIIEKATLDIEDPNFAWSKEHLLDIVDQGIRGVIGGGAAMGTMTGSIEMYGYAADTMKAYDERRAAEIDTALSTGVTPDPEAAATAMDMAEEVASGSSTTAADIDKVAGEAPKKGPVAQDDSVSEPRRQAELEAKGDLLVTSGVAATADTQQKTSELLAQQDEVARQRYEGLKAEAEQAGATGFPDFETFKANHAIDPSVLYSGENIIPKGFEKSLTAEEYKKYTALAEEEHALRVQKERTPDSVTEERIQSVRDKMALLREVAKTRKETLGPTPAAKWQEVNAKLAEFEAEKQEAIAAEKPVQKKIAKAQKVLDNAISEQKTKRSAKKLVKQRAQQKVDNAKAGLESLRLELGQVQEAYSEPVAEINQRRQDYLYSVRPTGPNQKTTASPEATNLEVGYQYNQAVNAALANPEVNVSEGVTPNGDKSAVTLSNVKDPKVEAQKAAKAVQLENKKTQPFIPEQLTGVEELRQQAYDEGKKALGLTDAEAKKDKERVIAAGISQSPSHYSGITSNEKTRVKTAPEPEVATESPSPQVGDVVDVDQGERVGLGTGEKTAPKIGAVRERKIRNVMLVSNGKGGYKLRPLADAVHLFKQRGYSDKDMAGFLAGTMNPNGPAPLRKFDDMRTKIGTAIMAALDFNDKREVSAADKKKKDIELRALLSDFDNNVPMDFDADVQAKIVMKDFQWGKVVAENTEFDWKRMYVESGGTNPAKTSKVADAQNSRKNTPANEVADNGGKQKAVDAARDKDVVTQVLISMLEGAVKSADKVKKGFSKLFRAAEYGHKSVQFDKKFGSKVAAAVEAHYGSKGKGGHVVAMLAQTVDWLNTGSSASGIELRRLADIVQRDFGIKTTSKDTIGRVFEVLDAALNALPSTGTDAKSRGGTLKYSAYDAYTKAVGHATKKLEQQKAYLALYKKVEQALDSKAKDAIDIDAELPDELRMDLMVLRLGAEFLGQNKSFIEAAYADVEAENVRNMEQTQVAETSVALDNENRTTISRELEVADAEETALAPWAGKLLQSIESRSNDPEAAFDQPTTLQDLVADGWMTQDEVDSQNIPSNFADVIDLATVKKDREVRGQQVFDLFKQLGSLMRGKKDAAFMATLIEVAAHISGRVDGKNGIHLYPARITARFGDESVKYSDGANEEADNTKRPMNRNIRATVLAKIQDIMRSDADSVDKAAAIEVILRQQFLLDDNAQSYTREAKGTNDVGSISGSVSNRLVSRNKRARHTVSAVQDGKKVNLKPHEITKLGMSRTLVDESVVEDDGTGASTKRSLRIRIFEGFLAGIAAAVGEGFDVDMKSISRDTIIYYALNDRERPVTYGEVLDYSKNYMPSKHKLQDEGLIESQTAWAEENKDQLEKLGVDPSEWESLLGTADFEVLKAEVDAAKPQTTGREDNSDEYSSLASTHDNEAAEGHENADLRKTEEVTSFFAALESDKAAREAIAAATEDGAAQAQEASERGVAVEKLPKGRLAQNERAALNGMRISKARPILTAWVRGVRTRLSRLQYRVAEAVDRITTDSDAKFNAFRGALDKAMGDDLAAGLDDYNAGRDTELAKRFGEVMQQVYNYAETGIPDFTAPEVVAILKRDALLADRSSFIAILNDAGIKKPEEMYEELVKTDGYLDTGVTPQVTGSSRKMQELSKAYEALKNAGYIESNPEVLMTSYLFGITQRTEWAKEFGRTVDGKFDINYGYETNTRILQTDDIKKVHELVQGALGQLGRNNYPTWLKKTNTALLTLQTATVLWLAGVASIPELGSVFVANRGNITRLHKDIAAVGRAHSFDRTRSREIAEVFGLVSRSITEHTLTQLVANGEITGNKVARGISNFVFKWSGQNLITDMARVSGTVMGRDYLARNAKAALKGDAVAKERLYELGITEQQVAGYLFMEENNGGEPIPLTYERNTEGIVSKTDKDVKHSKGKVVVNEAVEAYHMALARFVEGSTAVPNRMDVPLLMNDPRYVLLTSLKKFFYGYWNTVHKGIVRDVKQRKGVDKITPPLIAVAAILPLAFCAEWLREEIKYPSALGKKREQELDSYDWIKKVISASGGLGPAQAVASALSASEFSGNFLTALMGPSVNLGLDLVNGDLAKNPARLVPIVGQQPQLRSSFNKTVKEVLRD